MTRLDLIIAAVTTCPGSVAWLLARAWIALGNQLWPAVAPSEVPWIAARLAIGGTGLLLGLALLAAVAHSARRGWPQP